MKYTIINQNSGAPFIQQNYELIEDAEKRLESLKQKSAGSYPLIIVQVDDDGNFHELITAPESSSTSKPQEQPQRPRRQR